MKVGAHVIRRRAGCGCENGQAESSTTDKAPNILETGNASFRFRASAAAPKTRKEKPDP
jgi:hypothetical protein